MKTKLLLFLPIIVLTIYLFGCEGVQQSDYADTGVGGTIIDSATRQPLAGVEVRLEPGSTIFTNSDGWFYFANVHLGSSGGNFVLTMSKTGYDSIIFPVWLLAGDTTTRYNLVMFQSAREVYVNYNVPVIEFTNSFSMSSVDLYNIQTIQDTNFLYRDMRLRDADGTRTTYNFLTGYDHNSGNGWQTKFTNLLGNYTHDEFDALAYINGPGPITPADFPNDLTNSFHVGTSPNAVYGFYLLGRNNYSGDPKIYGMIRIADVYYDTNLMLNVVKIDIKVNRNGNNYFNLY
ncbi:MAG: carboxypeptidase-like regulatory domain-containing protein [Ignavibacteria bacterium]|nr:carboxypeptidase-like regulatory domain-containing protein [Ignavibacteria bacterium]